jgi:hypothetical protein
MQEPPAVPQALRTQERADSGALDALSDAQLLLEVARLASREREATADLVHALGEIDARKLFLKEGCASLFTYCTERLHLSGHAAYRVSRPHGWRAGCRSCCNGCAMGR